MPKYKRRPIVIEAFEWTGVYDPKTQPAWFTEAMKKDAMAQGALRIVNGDTLKIVHGNKILTGFRGDFIMRGPDGDLVSCRPEAFRALHDEVPV